MPVKTDERVTTDLEAELDANGLPLSVEVHDGVATLSGEVTSEAERQAAIDLAYWIDGVEEVQDDMSVMELVADSGSIDALFIDDDQSDTTDDPMVAAAEGLTYIPPIDPPVVADDDAPGYEVRGGFATSALDDAPEAAPRGDSELVDRVRRELAEDSQTSALRLRVGGRNGVVALGGRVEDRSASRAAVAVAGRVDGVRQVIDRTFVAPAAEIVESGEGLVRRMPTAHIATASSAWRAVVASNQHKLVRMREETQAQIDELEDEILEYGEEQEQEGTASSHQADLASDVDAVNRLSAERDAAQHRLMEIEEALERVKQGRYGICVDTGQLIDPDRLRAYPMAIRTLRAQEIYEQRNRER